MWKLSENPIRAPRDSRRLLTKLFNGELYIYLSPMNEKITRAIENELLKLKLNYNIIKLFKILCSLSDMVNS